MFVLSCQISVAADANLDHANPSDVELIVVVGADGTPEYGEQFDEWSQRWTTLAEQTGMSVVRLGPTANPSDPNRIWGEAQATDRDLLKDAIVEAKTESPRTLWLVMIGHGTFTRGVAKFNLRGPDVSAKELSGWLKPLKRTVVVINGASCSGPFLNALSGEKRVIVTATMSGAEQNFARFAGMFSEAIGSLESDLDHDDSVSVQEAFVRASTNVQRFYDSEDRLETEHALLEDNGDGKGTPVTAYRGTRVIKQGKDGEQVDGSLASRITIALSEDAPKLTDEALDKRDKLEVALERLRRRKSEMNTEAYERELEAVLVPLAKLYESAK